MQIRLYILVINCHFFIFDRKFSGFVKMSTVHSDCKKEIFTGYLENYIELLIIELERDLESHFANLETLKTNFQAVLALFSNSTCEVSPVKSSCKLKIILMKLLKHGKLGSVSTTDRSTLLDLCKILLQFLNNNDLITTVNEYIEHVHLDFGHQTCSKFIKSDINLFTFYAIDILLKTLETNNLQCNSMERLERIVIDVVLCCDNDVLCVILNYLIPNLIKYSNSNRILEEIWLAMERDCIQNASNAYNFMKCHDEQCLPRKISILCMLAQYYISTEKNSFPLVTKEHFWCIIYCGLIDSLAFHRKKALYLLKRSVDFLEVNCSTFKCNYFIWNENHVSHLKDIWKDIIIVLEVLEEKQLHLITPILPSVMKLTVINNIVGEDLLKENWLTCICQRLMNHESSQVVKWGIVNLICADVFFRLEYDPSFYRVIFNALNNTSLYSKNQVSDNFTVDKSLENWFLKFSYHPDRTFLRNVLHLFCDISWAPVPLFYVVRSLAATPKTACWDSSTLRILKKFIIETLGTQNVHIRGAIQCCLLRCVVNLTDISGLDYKTVFDLISVFRSSECLRRGTLSWKNLLTWLKTFIEPSKMLTFLKLEIDAMLIEDNTHADCVSVEAISRCVILMSDAGLFCGEAKTLVLTPIWKIFNYTFISNSKSVDRALLFLMNLVLELQTIESSDKTDITKELVFSLAIRCMSGAMSYIENGYKNWYGYMKEVATIQHHLSFIFCFGSYDSTKLEMKDSILKLVMDSYSVLIDKKMCNPMEKYFSLMLVSWVANYNCSQYKVCNLVSSEGIIAKSHQSFVKNLMKEQQINKILEGKDMKLCNDSINSKFSSSCVLAGWELFHSYIVAFDKSLSQVRPLIRIDQLVDLGLEAAQIGGKDVLIEINQVFEVILPKFINELETETLSKFISTTWAACFELRKNELFWNIFKSWIRMFYQKSLLESEKCSTLQLEYANKILELGETVGGLSNCLFKQLNEEIDNPDALALLSNDLIVKALVFGPVHRKDLRIESEVCNFIRSKGSEFSINILKPLTSDRDDCEVRLYVLNMILKVCIGEFTASKIPISVMESIMEEDSRISDKKKRYYGDSQHHRVKNRIVQVLLVLEHVIFQFPSSSSEVFYEKLLDWLSDNLSRESHQPSIRYQLQWLFVRCLLHKPRHLSKFWIMFEKGSEERAGCVCSYISIAYHLAIVLQRDAFNSRCVQEILPWCMAQHFNVRMYAQFVLSKLWSINEATGWSKEHNVIRTSLVKSLSKGSAIKNLPKLECDFYFSNFHPMKNFSLKSVFIELPRLASVTPDEWCSEMALEKCLHSSFDVIPLNDPITPSDEMKPLEDCQPATWTFKTRESAECTMETDIIQKKFVPWRDMLTEEESNSPSEKRKEGLIVVASLIDRPPNLGGLSRTCEVFGVSELVLNSLHYLTDKQFTSLSMSSEKHVNITEVKEYHMTDYIQKMKQSGFTIVGAEQTPGSVELTKFKFPCKTVLILGNEKEGIPANMLPLLDSCIVVPQYGLVRSLNVHVTGALFIWEYAKQYK